MSITTKQVEHLARLARIKLTPEEKEKYTKDLSAILDYVNKLQEVSSSAESGSAIEDKKEGRLREDKVVGLSSLEQDGLINSAPETEERLIKTKAVFE